MRAHSRSSPWQPACRSPACPGGHRAGLLSRGRRRQRHLELGDEELSIEANDIGYQLFAGYNFGRYFAIEAAWFDAGVLTDEVLGLDLEFGLDGFIGSAVGRVPLSDGFALFAKVGVASYDAEVGLGFDTQRDHQSDLSYAMGGELSFAEHWGLRIEYQSIDLSDGDFFVLGVSGLYRF